MISYVRGNLFESPAQTLVNTVNTVGVMGKGVALTFKTIYPDMFKTYRDLCERGDLTVGRLFLWRTPNKLVLNFPTKTNWRYPSKPEYIEAGLEAFVRSYESAGIHSVAFPPLGCGNGELDFDDVVHPLMRDYLSDLPIAVYIYAPHRRTSPAEHRVPARITEWLRSTPHDLPFTEVWEDLRHAYGGTRHLSTINRGTPFEAQFVDEGEGALRIWASGKTVTVGKDEFFELWAQLRDRGILTSGTVPSNRSKDASYLLPVFSELPYVEVVGIGEDFETFRLNPITGVQLVPPDRRKAQRELGLA